LGISPGMRQGIQHAETNGRPVDMRVLPNWGAAMEQHCFDAVLHVACNLVEAALRSRKVLIVGLFDDHTVLRGDPLDDGIGVDLGEGALAYALACWSKERP